MADPAFKPGKLDAQGRGNNWQYHKGQDLSAWDVELKLILDGCLKFSDHFNPCRRAGKGGLRYSRRSLVTRRPEEPR